MQKLIVSQRHLKKNNLLSTKENLKEVAKQLELITRVYCLNSKANKKEATYWLSYSFKVAACLTSENINPLMIANIKPTDILKET